MASLELTAEQQAVVHHLGGHARVLAVAGSGKTSTMVHRIKYLIDERNADPKRIRVLMFNALASKQFKERLATLGLQKTRTPFVNTFHSFALQFIQKAIKDKKLPHFQLWIDEEVEQMRITAHRTIQELVKNGKIPEDSVDIDAALEAIGLWKGALITPDRAGHHHNDYLPIVYERFEQKRIEKNALSFDDMVPMVVQLLTKHELLHKQWCGRLDYLIVDEYQDVNFGQQKLIELLAGERAEVMVVGDDDQTIYEWRGARPDYIIRDFQRTFPNRPHATYKLTRTFRFGPVIAQCAHNTIFMNANRQTKTLIAHDVSKRSKLHIVESEPDARDEAHYVMAREIVRLVKEERVPPSEIWVLARMYAQFTALEARCLTFGIPYHILGQDPFFKRSEVQKLLDYMVVGLHLDRPVTRQTKRALLHVINTPNRYLKRKVIDDTLSASQKAQKTLSACLNVLVDSDQSTLSHKQKTAVSKLHNILREANQRSSLKAASLLEWINERTGYTSHFKDYYGSGEDAFERIEAVLNFITYAHAADMEPAEFIEHVATLDSTLGASKEELITMATVYKTKGLEYDYIFIPSCQEGYMPCLYENEMAIYDKAGLVKETEPSLAIENERRLFYVAITRARKAAYIAAVSPSAADEKKGSQSTLPSRFLEEMRLHATLPVLEQLPNLPQLDKKQIIDWLKLVEAHGGDKQLISSLTTYLVMMKGKKLAAAITKLTESKMQTPFQYKYAYGKKTKMSDIVSSVEKVVPKPSVWDRID